MTISAALATAIQHHQAGQLEQAIDYYRRALAVDADDCVALNNLGAALQARGNLDEAVGSFRRATQIEPENAAAHSNLGTALYDLGKPLEALVSYRRALQLKPDDPIAHNNLGNACQALGNLDEAVAAYRQALRLKPDYSLALNNLGKALQAYGQLDEAINCYRRALELNPHQAQMHYLLGTALQAQGKPDDAITAYRQVLALNPNHVEAHHNLGVSLTMLQQYDHAVASFDRAIELDPHCADAHFCRSMLRLLSGDFHRGWPEYEWRWKTNQLQERKFRQPLWDGSPLGRRAVVLHAEQGFGDTFQFIRYAALIKQQNPAATVIVGFPPPLASLLARCPGVHQFIAEGNPLPPFDVHAPLLSLPRILSTTLETIPADVPYLFADPALIDHWRNRLASINGLRVGINWQGRQGQGEHRQRDIPLEYLTTLAQLPGVSLISLQRGAARDELLAAIQNGLPIADLGDDFDTAHGAFSDTAAIMKNLDLVITSDTAIPHLAGALAVPVWLALPTIPDWRWLLDRTDSPWYPTMRLFRQTTPGDWTTVFAQLKTNLTSLGSP